jgi:Fe-S-cluster containining protein
VLKTGVSRLGELTAKIDGFFARVEARHGDDMQCQTGCSDCCHVRLSITGVEADAIRAYVETHPVTPGTRPDVCAALDEAGRCQIYEARPVVCRSHGVPIRLREDSLPVVRNCFRNFTHTEPAADCVLDQETLSTLVLAVDRAVGNTGDRVDLAMLLGEVTTR